jgi:hypothetical protein
MQALPSLVLRSLVRAQLPCSMVLTTIILSNVEEPALISIRLFTFLPPLAVIVIKDAVPETTQSNLASPS